MIYLDNAATTFKKPDAVSEAIQLALKNCSSVGRGGYASAMNAAEIVYTARERAAELFGAENAEQVVFTNNATHSLNIAIKGIAPRGNCVISGYEHNSVVRPITAIPELEYRVARGTLFEPESIIKNFERAIDKNTSLVVCTQMSNVFGYILPIERIDELCAKKGIPLIIDASQSAGCIDIKLKKLKATVCICAPGHKGLYGPQGTGVLICKSGEKLKPLIEGGTGSVSNSFSQPDFMPDRLECGTHNVPGIAGLSEGIKYILEKGTREIFRHERKLIYLLNRELKKTDGIRVFARNDLFLQGGVVSFVSNSLSPEKIAKMLSEKDIAVRSGLHCSPLAHETVGTSSGTVRISVSFFTDEREIFEFVDVLKGILK